MTTTGVQNDGLLLIVDDEPLITDLLTQALTRRGFNVVSAGDATEALAVSRGRCAELRLVITDMAMPGISGLELSRQLDAESPGLPVLIATGFDAEDAMCGMPANVVGIVSKPYQTSSLVDTIRTILNSKEPS